MNNAFIAIGSNLSAPIKQVNHSIHQLKQLHGTKLIKQSSFYQTAELNGKRQPNYINAMAWVQTMYSPRTLLNQLQSIEIAMGRPKKHSHHESRIIDLDIILYENIEINTQNLTIPHPGLFLRNFVLYPLGEIAPNWQLPCGQTVNNILKKTQLKQPKRVLL